MNGFPKMWNIQKGVWQGAHTSHLMMVKRDMGRRPVEYNWLVIFDLVGVGGKKGKVSSASQSGFRYQSIQSHI